MNSKSRRELPKSRTEPVSKKAKRTRPHNRSEDEGTSKRKKLATNDNELFDLVQDLPLPSVYLFYLSCSK